MDLIKIIEQLDILFYDLRKQYDMYMCDSTFIELMDSQLNGNLKSLAFYCESNGLEQLIKQIKAEIPVAANAPEVFTIYECLKDTILQCHQYLSGSKRKNVVLDIAYELQSSMTKREIENYLQGFNVKYDENDYQYNSKRVYVENILRRVENDVVLSIAKELDVLESKLIENAIDNKISNIFINEQLDKIKYKLKNNDFDGVITNSRSLIEEIILDIEKEILGEKQDYDGDILKLYKRVRKLINLEPNNNKIDNSLNEIMRGFIQIISGFSGLSNKMGDRHARTYKPEERHARLAANSAIVVSEFLLDVYHNQKENQIDD